MHCNQAEASPPWAFNAKCLAGLILAHSEHTGTSEGWPNGMQNQMQDEQLSSSRIMAPCCEAIAAVMDAMIFNPNLYGAFAKFKRFLPVKFFSASRPRIVQRLDGRSRHSWCGKLKRQLVDVVGCAGHEGVPILRFWRLQTCQLHASLCLGAICSRWTALGAWRPSAAPQLLSPRPSRSFQWAAAQPAAFQTLLLLVDV